MCIAIHKKKGVILDPLVYENSFNRNDHGAGFAYVDGGELIVKKGIKKVEDFVAAIQEVEQHELIIHCRLMSKGEISEQNCHPFHIKSSLFSNMEFAIIHNGTLSWRSTDKRSDTSFFVEDALQPIIDRDPYFFEFNLNRAMMASYIGITNKLVIMRINKTPDKKQDEKACDVFIVNRAEGIEYKGCWFSNLSFTDESNRYIFESDRKKIDHWQPKAYKEYKAPAYVPTPSYSHGGHSYQQQDFFPPNGADGWKWADGFGWYNPDTKYKGRRNINEFKAWEKKKDKKDDAHLKDLDPMPYLDKDEHKMVRRECVSIVRDSFPHFDFKGVSTVELATWARAELRELLPAMKEMSNQTMMKFILKGNVMPAGPGETLD